ncbi:hypothetical protein [Aliamphritea spongicola]|nr:hypothetical protein [Aliamphritea spongicola]
MNNPVPIQLPLGIALRDDARFETYLSRGNELVCNCLAQVAIGEGDIFLYLWEPRALDARICCRAPVMPVILPDVRRCICRWMN